MIVARIVTIARMISRITTRITIRIAAAITAEEATIVVAIDIVEAGATARTTAAGTIAPRTKRAYALTVDGQGIQLRNAEPISVLSAGSLRI